MSPLRLALPVLLALAASALRGQDQAADQNNGCRECHSGSDANTMEFDCGTEVAIVFDKRALLESAHGKFACLSCHNGLDPLEHVGADHGKYVDYRRALAARCAACHDGTATDVAAALRPQHALAGHLHAADLDGAPLCTDCHAAHAVARGDRIGLQAAKACAQCHDAQYAEFAASVHGGALGEPPNGDLPTCVDCHAGHGQAGRGGAVDNVRLGRPCITCHADGARMDRYRLSTRVVSTYLNDFHGVSVHYYGRSSGSTALPTLVCADCHGTHEVAPLAKLPPEQMKAKLLSVCRTCHPDAAEDFPDAWLSHYEPSPTKAPLVFAVKLGYWIFIPLVIGGLSLQIFAHVVIHQRRRRKQHAPEPGHELLVPGDEHRWVRRFSNRQRLEHLLVVLTFALLLLTGLPQKFHDNTWALVVTGLFGGIDTMRGVHRVVGIVFAGLCVQHLVVAVGGVLARRHGMTIVPTRQDFRDAAHNLRYYLGSAAEPPRFDRFDYRQKFEYWGMIVGSLVMIVSGFVLYFPMQAAAVLPGQVIPAMKAAHTYEAMMALLTIIVWHMYGAFLNPDCRPLDRTIFSGHISLARMKLEHTLEWQREKDRLEVVEEPAAGTAAAAPAATPAP
ncbi:MAG: cytochrome b/b6 domain-containing protein [Planctomycetota bacterium]